MGSDGLCIDKGSFFDREFNFFSFEIDSKFMINFGLSWKYSIDCAEYSHGLIEDSI